MINQDRLEEQRITARNGLKEYVLDLKRDLAAEKYQDPCSEVAEHSVVLLNRLAEVNDWLQKNEEACEIAPYGKQILTLKVCSFRTIAKYVFVLNDYGNDQYIF